MKIDEYMMVGKKLIGLCIAAFLVSQIVAAYNGGASGRVMGLSNEQNGVDCIGGSNGLDCAITSGVGVPVAPALPPAPDAGMLVHPTPYVSISIAPDLPSYEDPYAKCQINLSEKELANEAELQKEIDALYEQINALYDKINEKTSQLPQHYNQSCMTQVDRDNLKERCNLTDDDLARMDEIQAEINALYEKLGGADDEKTWEEINQKEQELSNISTCVYGPMMPVEQTKPGEPMKQTEPMAPGYIL